MARFLKKVWINNHKKVSSCAPVIQDLAVIHVLSAALRVEWCKAQARTHRWQEECLLLDEEMRRVTRFFTWQIKMWKERATANFPTVNNVRSPENRHLAGGIAEQAAVDEGGPACICPSPGGRTIIIYSPLESYSIPDSNDYRRGNIRE